MKIKIYGLRRSGSNLLESLLEDSGFEVLPDGWSKEKPWKHGPPRECADKHICLVKDPFAWWVSSAAFYHQSRVHVPEDFKKIVGEYFQLARDFPQKWFILTYEDLRKGRIKSLEKFLGKKINYREVKGLMNWDREETDESFDHSFYDNHEYLEFLTRDDINRLDIKGSFAEQFVEKWPDRYHKPPICLSANAMGIGDSAIATMVAANLRDYTGRKVILHSRHMYQCSLWLGKGSRALGLAPQNSTLINGHEQSLHRKVNVTGRITYQGMSRIEGYISFLPKMYRDMPLEVPKLLRKIKPKVFDGITMFPAASLPQRTYPYNQWEEVLNSLEKRGVNVRVPVPMELDSREEIFKTFDKNVVKFDEYDFPLSILGSSLVLGNDSGPMHIAGLMGTPGVCALAMWNPEDIFPYESLSFVQGKGWCSPCNGLYETNFRKECLKGCQVLNEISPDKIAEETLKRLDK